MSEAMALERLTEMLAELHGYLTTTRVPFLARYSRAGAKKSGTQQGDLDLVALGRGRYRRLLVAECKGWGRPEDYPQWLTPGYLWELDAGVQRLAGNIGKVTDPRWSREFAKRRNRPDEVWYVFPGKFDVRSDPSRWRLPTYVRKECAPFVRVMSHEAASCRQAGLARDRAEARLLRAAERALAKRHRVRVRLLPVHRLLRALFDGIAEDMLSRRRRYPDTAAELLRWTARTVRHGLLDLADFQKRLRQE